MTRAPNAAAPTEIRDTSALSLAEARRRLLEAVLPVTDAETLELAQAHGRTLAREVVAAMDVPPFRASAMDGYAVRSTDLGGDACAGRPVDARCVLRVVASSLAGHPSGDRVAAGECVRVTTGARVPDDCDAVVQQENVERGDDGRIRVSAAPAPGHHVRDSGSDSRAGDPLATPGTPLRAAALAVFAAHGIADVPVYRRPRVGLLSTGDELRDPGTPLGPGAVHDANRTLLSGLLAGAGVEVIDLGIVADTPQALSRTLSAHRDIDAWVSSGGVSVGEADHVRDVLDADGDVMFWKVAMKPGRPLAFGHVRGRPWFGLPGNPVSAAVTTLLLLRPALARLCGRVPPEVHGVDAHVEGVLVKTPGRLEFQRGRLHVDARGRRIVEDAGLQESHGLRALQRANCLVELPADSTGAAHGEIVTVYPFESFAEPPL